MYLRTNTINFVAVQGGLCEHEYRKADNYITIRKAAERYLSKPAVISNRDLDPKNVMWNGDNPYIIDWEAAGYVNPYQEFLEVVNYWADDGAGKLVEEKFDAIVNEYCKYMDIGTVIWDEVFHGSYIGMLGWLEYNVKRALGMEISDEAEILLGEEQVIGTIHELYSYQGKIRQMQKWLGYGKNRILQREV